jgi:hypothetical protein
VVTLTVSTKAPNGSPHQDNGQFFQLDAHLIEQTLSI